MKNVKVEENPRDKGNFWRVRHIEAIRNPKQEERPILKLLDALEDYRRTYRERFNSEIEDDYILGHQGYLQIIRGTRELLNGEIGRLDAGTIDKYLVELLQKFNVEI